MRGMWLVLALAVLGLGFAGAASAAELSAGCDMVDGMVVTCGATVDPAPAPAAAGLASGAAGGFLNLAENAGAFEAGIVLNAVQAANGCVPPAGAGSVDCLGAAAQGVVAG